MEYTSFSWGKLLLPLEHLMENYGVDPHVGIDVLVVAIALSIIAYFGGKKYRRGEEVEPSGVLDFHSFLEVVIGGIFNFTKSFLHDKAGKFFFLFGSLTLFILFNNLIGVIPGFHPPTNQFNTTIVLGLFVFVTTHIVGLQVHGAAYIKHFTGPVWWLAWLIFPIELISHLVRPLSLALRLFGNMTGDHKVVGVFFLLMPLFIPLPMIGMGIFVAFVQTFVFLLLSLVYISGALEHAH